MVDNLISKIFTKFGKNDVSRLKKANQVAAGIMLINLISQLYLKSKYDANWKFLTTRKKIKIYNESETEILLKNLSVDEEGRIKYLHNGKLIDSKPEGCVKNRECECEPLFTEILSGTYDCETKSTETSIANTMIIFSGLTLLSHLMILTILKKKYIVWIKKYNVNFVRWIEYSITSSIMIYAICGLTGIRRSEEQVPIIILSAVTNILGLSIESIKSKKKEFKNVRKIVFFSGIVAQMYPWTQILYSTRKNIEGQNIFLKNIEKNINEGKINDTKLTNLLIKRIETFKKVQGIIKTIVISLFLSYFTFPFIMYRQYFRCKTNYTLGEFEYILASIFTKSLLSWQIYGGAFRTA